MNFPRASISSSSPNVGFLVTNEMHATEKFKQSNSNCQNNSSYHLNKLQDTCQKKESVVKIVFTKLQSTLITHKKNIIKLSYSAFISCELASKLLKPSICKPRTHKYVQSVSSLTSFPVKHKTITQGKKSTNQLGIRNILTLKELIGYLNS